MKLRFVVIEEANEDPSKDMNWYDSYIGIKDNKLFFEPLDNEAKLLSSKVTEFNVATHNGETFRIQEIKAPTFKRGEIIIVDEWGREVDGPQRKPSKWDIKYRVFDNLEEAVKYAQKILYPNRI